MKRALSELRITGIETTVPFHLQILKDSNFVDGCIDTTYVERTWAKRS
jgi:acetyl-CoA carboxylase biotin carboxylase subunit